MAAHKSKFSVTILGSNSALPANGRNPTSQLLNVNNHYYLIDCGEGTQMQLRKFGVKMQRIKVIFISHMHGDHYFGLVGLLNSLHLLGRKMPLAIYAPKALQDIVRLQLDASGGRLQFPIQFHEIIPPAQGTSVIYDDNELHVECFRLKHRIPCSGFLFREQLKERTYLPDKGGRAGVKVEEIPTLKKGEDVVREDGSVIQFSDFTDDPPSPRTYAFCTDTLALDSTAEIVRGAECLYHEATFLESEIDRSKQTFHSTAKQAAQVALAANVGKLLIGHYSARYNSLDDHLAESQSVFANTELTSEGKEFEIN
jgi:ribonuclease Z